MKRQTKKIFPMKQRGGRHIPPSGDTEQVELNDAYNKHLAKRAVREQREALEQIQPKEQEAKERQEQAKEQEAKERQEQAKEQEAKERQEPVIKLEYDKLLTDIFYKNHNYDGATELYRKAKLLNKSIKKIDVSAWLKLQTVNQVMTNYSLQKPENLPIYAQDPYSFQMDLTFLPMYTDANDGNYVMFTAINIDTRYSFASFAKNKEGTTILNLLNDFYDDAAMVTAITSDSGSEFTNKECMKWFKAKDIKTYFVVGDSHKLGIINRFHRTLKSKIEKYMIANDTARWIDILPEIIANLNNTYNRGIGCTPKQASNPITTASIINKAIDETIKIKKHEQIFEIGQLVRILKPRKLFEKTQTTYSDEVYKIVKVNLNTVSVADDDENMYTGIKKKYLLVLPSNYKPTHLGVKKKQVETTHKIKSKIAKEKIAYNPDPQDLSQAVKGGTDRKKKTYDD